MELIQTEKLVDANYIKSVFENDLKVEKMIFTHMYEKGFFTRFKIDKPEIHIDTIRNQMNIAPQSEFESTADLEESNFVVDLNKYKIYQSLIIKNCFIINIDLMQWRVQLYV